MNLSLKNKIIFICFLVFTGGCAVNVNKIITSSGPVFVYKPAEPTLGVMKSPMTVAVLPFKNGTEDFILRGSAYDPESLTFNLSRTGIGGIINPLPPEFWAKALADDMAASANFKSVRYINSPAELLNEEFYIEGTLEKTYVAGGYTKPSEYVLNLQALRSSDHRPVWGKRVTREIFTQKSEFNTCGTNLKCMSDRSHAGMNSLLQEMFAEARADFMATQGFAQRGRTELDSATTVTPLNPESVDETIEMILKGK